MNQKLGVKRIVLNGTDDGKTGRLKFVGNFRDSSGPVH